MPSRPTRRGLSTARAALQVAWLLAARPEGIRADAVAEKLGKSVSTAYNLLVSLCDEGVAVHHSGGLYRLAPAFAEVVTSAAAVPADEPDDLSGVVCRAPGAHPQALLPRRSPRGCDAHRPGARGPGDGPAARARSGHCRPCTRWRSAGGARDGPARGRRAYLQAGLRCFSVHRSPRPTPCATSARGPPPWLRGRPRGVRPRLLLHRGAGVLDPRGAVVRCDRDLDYAQGVRRGAREARADRRRRRAAAGARARAGAPDTPLSTYDIARFQASSEIPQVLDRPADAVLGSGRATTVP